MGSQILAKESYALIRKNFDLNNELDENSDGFQQLFVILRQEVQKLLDHDFNHLLNILYRIDIAESRLKHILEISKPEEIADELTREIIDRHRQKVITRLRYNS
ncbi:MAG: hypothetical protein ACI8TA_003343 [Cyclobacteriaceae bacterium]|jgi:hypothetical protein